MIENKKRSIENEKRRKHCKIFLIEKDLTIRQVAEILNIGEQFLYDFISGGSYSQRVAEFFEYKRESN